MKKIAVIGVQDSIGREILAYLADGGYKPADVAALEPKAPLGTQVSFGEEDDIDVFGLEDLGTSFRKGFADGSSADQLNPSRWLANGF